MSSREDVAGVDQTTSAELSGFAVLSMIIRKKLENDCRVEFQMIEKALGTLGV